MWIRHARRARARRGANHSRLWDEDQIRREWGDRLAGATLKGERDELDELFGRALP